MLVDGHAFRTVWIPEGEEKIVRVIDQRCLPRRFDTADLRTVDEVVTAIRDMWVRGAGCIGATSGYGMWLASCEAAVPSCFRRGGRSRYRFRIGHPSSLRELSSVWWMRGDRHRS